MIVRMLQLVITPKQFTQPIYGGWELNPFKKTTIQMGGELGQFVDRELVVKTSAVDMPVAVGFLRSKPEGEGDETLGVVILPQQYLLTVFPLGTIGLSEMVEHGNQR